MRRGFFRLGILLTALWIGGVFLYSLHGLLAINSVCNLDPRLFNPECDRPFWPWYWDENTRLYSFQPDISLLFTAGLAVPLFGWLLGFASAWVVQGFCRRESNAGDGMPSAGLIVNALKTIRKALFIYLVLAIVIFAASKASTSILNQRVESLASKCEADNKKLAANSSNAANKKLNADRQENYFDRFDTPQKRYATELDFVDPFDSSQRVVVCRLSSTTTSPSLVPKDLYDATITATTYKRMPLWIAVWAVIYLFWFVTILLYVAITSGRIGEEQSVQSNHLDSVINAIKPNLKAISSGISISVLLIAALFGSIFGKTIAQSIFAGFGTTHDNRPQVTKAVHHESLAPEQMPEQTVGRIKLRYANVFVRDEKLTSNTMKALPVEKKTIIESFLGYKAASACGIDEALIQQVKYVDGIQINVDRSINGSISQTEKLEGIQQPSGNIKELTVSGYPARLASFSAKRWGGVIGAEILTIGDGTNETLWLVQFIFTAKQTADAGRLEAMRECASRILSTVTVMP